MPTKIIEIVVESWIQICSVSLIEQALHTQMMHDTKVIHFFYNPYSVIWVSSENWHFLLGSLSKDNNNRKGKTNKKINKREMLYVSRDLKDVFISCRGCCTIIAATACDVEPVLYSLLAAFETTPLMPQIEWRIPDL